MIQLKLHYQENVPFTKIWYVYVLLAYGNNI